MVSDFVEIVSNPCGLDRLLNLKELNTLKVLQTLWIRYFLLRKKLTMPGFVLNFLSVSWC
jgi:hypothetical protein